MILICVVNVIIHVNLVYLLSFTRVTKLNCANNSIFFIAISSHQELWLPEKT